MGEGVAGAGGWEEGSGLGSIGGVSVVCSCISFLCVGSVFDGWGMERWGLVRRQCSGERVASLADCLSLGVFPAFLAHPIKDRSQAILMLLRSTETQNDCCDKAYFRQICSWWLKIQVRIEALEYCNVYDLREIIMKVRYFPRSNPLTK
jgi:hypothetical protein